MPKALAPELVEAIEESLRTAEQPKQNEIARAHNVSPSTIRRIAASIGVTFDRTMTKRANEASVVDAMTKATKLAERMADEAALLLDSLHSQYLVYNFGGKDNDYNEHTLEVPPIEVQRSIFVMAGIAIDKVSKLQREQGGGLVGDSALDAFLKLLAPGDDDTLDLSES